jgi:hypothetical protein
LSGGEKEIMTTKQKEEEMMMMMMMMMMEKILLSYSLNSSRLTQVIEQLCFNYTRYVTLNDGHES